MWTHLPVLAWCIARTKGLIVEFGVGDFSTPFLHFFAEVLDRDVISYEETDTWLEKWAHLFTGHHKGLMLPDGVGLATDADVVLVDGSAESRGPIIRQLAPYPVRFVVVHDTQPGGIDTHPGMREALELYRHRFDWTTILPGTSVVSNVSEVL